MFEPEPREYIVYLNQMPFAGELGDAFRLVYFEHLDNLRANKLSNPHTIEIVWAEDGWHRIYHFNDVIGACERFCPWLSSGCYLLLTSVRIGSILRSFLNQKLSSKKFSERLIAEAEHGRY